MGFMHSSIVRISSPSMRRFPVGSWNGFLSSHDCDIREGGGFGKCGLLASPNVGIAVGANNLFDIYPDPLTIANNSTGAVAFPYYSPFGFNGRYLYGRINVTW